MAEALKEYFAEIRASDVGEEAAQAPDAQGHLVDRHGTLSGRAPRRGHRGSRIPQGPCIDASSVVAPGAKSKERLVVWGDQPFQTLAGMRKQNPKAFLARGTGLAFREASYEGGTLNAHFIHCNQLYVLRG